MKKYRKKPALVDAVQWFRNGDHPEDNSKPIDVPAGTAEGRKTEGEVVRFYRNLNIPGDRFCEVCGNHMHRHGLIATLTGDDEEIVHPGDYIVTDVKGRFYRRSQKDFEEMFELYEPVELTELEGAVDFEDLKRRIEAIEEHFTGAANSDPANLRLMQDAYKPAPVIPDPGKVQ